MRMVIAYQNQPSVAIQHPSCRNAKCVVSCYLLSDSERTCRICHPNNEQILRLIFFLFILLLNSSSDCRRNGQPTVTSLWPHSVPMLSLLSLPKYSNPRHWQRCSCWTRRCLACYSHSGGLSRARVGI